MHLLMMIVGGIVLLGLFLLFGQLWGGDTPSMALAAKYFLPVWLVIALVNLWVGVAKAGYSLREELPVLAIVIVVPALASAIAIWRLAR